MATLEELHIQNFAIIEDLKVRFAPGLNVLTGETGAGKSILIGAIQLLLGGKAGSDLIRLGAEEALVEGLFGSTGTQEYKTILESYGLTGSDDVILKRVVSRSGRGRAYVNGQFCTLRMLTELGRRWVNIYGQHEHQLLLQPDRHLDLLDAFGGLSALRDQWEKEWQAWLTLKADIQTAEAGKREAEAMQDLWEFQCAEIEGAQLVPGEEEVLEKERQILLHAHRIQERLHRAEDALYAGRGSALEKAQLVLRELEELKEVDSELSGVIEILSEVSLGLEEGVSRIREHIRHVEMDPERLEAVEERLGEVQRLKRKYKGTIPEIISLANDLRLRLREIQMGKDDLETLFAKKAALTEALQQDGKALTQARTHCGKILAEGVERELRDLGIDQPVFQVSLSPLEEGEKLGDVGIKAGNRGMDRVEFLLTTNIGEEPRSLSRIASGGELSRIMLALKKVLAEAERIPTLIFDEIDAGIGGAVAQALGEKLHHISQTHQVLCVTHLPQIACFAKHHLRVIKHLDGRRTVTQVEPLGEAERLEEISRMLGGKVITDKTRAHARELLQRVSG
jgi:DNA repair protein RecN (Recombination protein N)